MAGANSISGLGLYYVDDPTGENHTEAFIYETQKSFQVLIPQNKNVPHFRVIAECIFYKDAEKILEDNLKQKAR